MAPQPFYTPANIVDLPQTQPTHQLSMQTRTRFPQKKRSPFHIPKGGGRHGKNIKFESLEFPWGYLAQTMSAILKHHSSPSSPLYALTLSWMWPDLASHQTSTNHVECIGSFTEKWCFTETCWERWWYFKTSLLKLQPRTPARCCFAAASCWIRQGIESSSHQDTPSGHLDLSAFHVHKSLKHTHTHIYI